MSCLILSDMSLSDQIAVEVSHANNRKITIEEEMAKLERMLANHHAPMRSYASRQFPTVTRSGTGAPSPADIAARDELIEVKS